jgi:dTDP-4-dehydrorhamnose 3,5-epimerase
MPFIETEIKGVTIFEPQKYQDERGYFMESYNQKTFSQNGINAIFIQDNQSFSQYGTLRGLHFQKGELAQAKLVRVLSGRVLDVAVDLRDNSETYGKHVAIELSAQNNRQLFIPRGFAHGFVVLSQTAEFFYKCDNVYSKEHEAGLIYDDKELNIDWIIPEVDMIISEKDKNLPSLKNL